MPTEYDKDQEIGKLELAARNLMPNQDINDFVDSALALGDPQLFNPILKLFAEKLESFGRNDEAKKLLQSVI